MPHRGLLDIESLSVEQIQRILDRARSYQPLEARTGKKLDKLAGKTVIHLFFESSTRTRTSFEIAAQRLGADTISITSSGSSVDKGESLIDTVNTLAAMRPDAIVMRHAASGAPHFLARALAARNEATPIINAGDGTHEHPTQGLLDALTILDHKPRLQGLRVAIIGDISNSRVARSNIHLLTKFGANVVLCGPPPMLSRSFEQFSPLVKRTHRMEEAIARADVIMMLRVQLERGGKSLFASDNEYFRFYGLRFDHLQMAQPDAIVMHPGPINRGRELSSEVADFPRSAILNQVENGIAVRMAVLDLLLAEGHPEARAQMATPL